MQALQHAQLSVTDDGVATLQIANGTSLNILNSASLACFCFRKYLLW